MCLAVDISPKSLGTHERVLASYLESQLSSVAKSLLRPVPTWCPAVLPSNSPDVSFARLVPWELDRLPKPQESHLVLQQWRPASRSRRGSLRALGSIFLPDMLVLHPFTRHFEDRCLLGFHLSTSNSALHLDAKTIGPGSPNHCPGNTSLVFRLPCTSVRSSLPPLLNHSHLEVDRRFKTSELCGLTSLLFPIFITA